MNEIGSFASDENNNEEQQNANKSGSYVERHLDLGTENDDFLIIPNGGSGDCMFKAVSQAVYNGDESKHREIRKRVVNFIISQRWDKFSESIEVQHINGNNLLQRQWAKDPKDAYKMYMTMSGTLGSSSELTATGEVFHFNFATIQEYCSSSQPTYRVENCLMSEDDESDFHYFYFTGDYDNGHWEYIKNLSGKKLEDGTYQGRHRIVINGEEISFEEWLKRETSNTNDADLLKIATNHSVFTRRRTAHPFELKCYQFCRDGTVRLKGSSFTIAPVQCSDLFSVLAFECLKNETSAHDIELILMKHRYSYFEDLNYKLITQPWSHNFTIDALRYCGQSLKGNIQDLIAAADLYSFSFILFLKMSDEGDTHQCKFTHVDRWGGESDRVLYFFMRLSRSTKGEQEQLIAKWWRLNPVDNNSPVTSANAKSFPKKSVARLVSGDNMRSTGLVPNSSKPSDLYVMKRSVTADSYSSKKSVSRAATPRPSTVQGGPQDFETTHEIFRGATSAHELVRREEREPKCQVLQGGITVRKVSDSEAGMETDECFKKDQEKLFGSRPLSRKSSAVAKSSSSSKNTARLVKKEVTSNQKIKPATGRDLLKHPEKVKTVVKISDTSNGVGRELTYRGSGYMKADDVLHDLKNQGLIRMPTPRPGRASSYTATRTKASDIIVPRIRSADARQMHYDALLSLRDENFNVIVEESKEDEENEDSDVSYEDFAASVAKAAKLDEDDVSEQEVSLTPNDDNWRLQVNKGQQFPPQDLFPAAMAFSRNKLNKVMPGENQAYSEPQDPYYRKAREYNKYRNMDDEYEERDTCINRMTHAFERLAAGLRKLTRRIRDSIIRRYEGYGRPSSMTNNAKRTKQFPRRKIY